MTPREIAEDLAGQARSLEKALEEDDSRASTWGRLGEVRRRQGAWAEAYRCFVEARMLDENWAELHAWRARLLASLGRSEEAAVGFARARRLGAPAAECEAPAFSRELGGSGEAGEADASRKELDRAVARDPSASNFVARARKLEDFGLPMEGVDDYCEAISLEPGAASHFVGRARALFCHRHYELSLRDFARALELEPGNADAFALRCEVYFALNRFEEAVADIDAALRLRPGLSALRLKRCEALALGGGKSRALAAVTELEKYGVDAAKISWLRGYILCLLGKHASAVAAFDAAAAGADEPRLRERSELHATAARLCRLRMPLGRAGRKGRVLLCGMGVQAPGSLTVEAALALRSCDAVFRNVSGEEETLVARIFSRRCRPVVFRHQYDVSRAIDLIFSAARGGRTSAFLTYGHPMIFGPLAHELLRRAAVEGIEVLIFPGLSSIDAMLAAGGKALGFSYGNYQLINVAGDRIVEDLPRLNPRLPALLYFPESLSERRKEEFCRGLFARYPAGHPALFFDPHNETWSAPSGRPLEDLRGLSPQFLMQCLIFIPPSLRSPA